MINEVNFLQSLHTATQRDYLARMNTEKPECMRVAKQYGEDYWDGDRKYGYGGYKYDGRWKPVAEAMVKHYGLRFGDKILDIGCGKGALLGEFEDLRFQAKGMDISQYALEELEKQFPRCRAYFNEGSCAKLNWNDKIFAFVYSINVFHNLGYSDLKQAIREMVRVSKDKRYLCVESYRTEEELCNLQCWALTCQSFYSPDDWKCILDDNGYSGDVEFITFS